MSSRPSSRSASEQITAPALLKELCCRITGLPEDEIQPSLQRACTVLGSNFNTPAESDEFQVSERIRRRLSRRGREKDAVTFAELHRKLQSQGLVKNRWAVLYLLMSLSETESRMAKEKPSSMLFGRGLPSYATSTPFNVAGRRPLSTPSDPGQTVTPRSVDTTASSGISSIHGDLRSNDPTPVPQSFLPSNTFASVDGDRSGKPHPSRLVGAISKHDPGSESAIVPRGGRGHTAVIKVQGDNVDSEIPEVELVKDLIYAFQGIDGKWIRFDAARDGYKVDPRVISLSS